jgi:hypothetical protein
MGYEGTSAKASRSGIRIEFVSCRNGAEMRATCVQVAYDLIRDEGLKEGQVAVITEAPQELAQLCEALDLNASTDP